MPRRPAVSTMRMSQPKLAASRLASLARRRTSGVPLLAVVVELAFVEVDAGGFGDDGELLAGGGAVDVDGDEHGAVAALFEPLGELGGGGGFAGALEAGHEDDGGGLRGGLELGDVLAEEGDELVVDDLYDLLGGREGGGDLGAQGLGADVLDELRDDGEVDVGLEEGEADLAHGVGDVFVGDGALAAEVLKERWSLSERFSNMAPQYRRRRKCNIARARRVIGWMGSRALAAGACGEENQGAMGDGGAGGGGSGQCAGAAGVWGLSAGGERVAAELGGELTCGTWSSLRSMWRGMGCCWWGVQADVRGFMEERRANDVERGRWRGR